MRVLHLDTGPSMRGGQYQVLLLHDTLAERDCEQTLLGGRGIRTRRAVERATWQSVRGHARECEVIHAHDARAHTLAVLHGRKRPVVVSRRVSFPIKGGPASRWKYRRASHFVAISSHVATILQAAGVPEDKVSVVHDAAPDSPAAAVATAAGDRKPREDGEAFHVVAPNVQDPLKCPELAAEACRAAGVRIRFSDDLATDLAAADALLYLSESEGLGSAILLAMSLGVPVIASDIGGIPEAVAPGTTGLLVQNSVASVASALRVLQQDAGLRATMAGNARREAASKFSKRRMAERTLEIYRKVVAGTAARPA